MNFISLCMIVKNEEQVLDRCLNSVSGIVDEIIIVDTGSSDLTKNIAYKYTDKVFDYNWTGNFAEARNYAKDKATGKWILVLDADEYVDKENLKEAIDQLKKDQDQFSVYSVKINNFAGNHGERIIQHFHDRIYKYTDSIGFERAIHEQIVDIKNEPLNKGISKLVIYHSGYINKVVKNKNKSDRNIDLLLKEIEKSNNAFDYFNLGNEFYALENYEKSLDYYKEAFTRKKDIQHSWVSFCVFNMVQSLLKLNQQTTALEIIQDAEKIWGLAPEFPYLKAVIYLNQNRTEEAIEILEQIIYGDSKSEYKNFIISPDYKDYLPHIILGKLHAKNKNFKEAILNFANAYSYNSKSEEAKTGILKILTETNTNLPELIKFIDEQINPITENDLVDLCVILIKCKEKDIVKSYIEKIQNKTVKKGFLFKIGIIKKDESSLLKLNDTLSLEELLHLLNNSIIDVFDLIIGYFITGEVKHLDSIQKLLSPKEYNFIESVINNSNYNSITESKYFLTLIDRIALYNLEDKLSNIIDFRYQLPTSINQEIGDLLYKHNKQEFSMKYYDEITNKTFLTVNSFANICEFLIENNQFAAALNYANQAIELERYDFRIIRSLIKIFREIESYEDIINTIDFGLNIYKESSVLVIELKAIFTSLLNNQDYQLAQKSINVLQKHIGDNLEILNLQSALVLAKELNISTHDNSSVDYSWKERIEALINTGNINYAKELIHKFQDAMSSDVDYYSMNGIIAILEKNYETAEELLFKALLLDSNNIDVYYNLGYLYEVLNEYEKAHLYYTKALIRCRDKELEEDIQNKLRSIQKEYPNLLKSRVLMVAYAFPPIGGSGVQRTLKFAKYLNENGWTPIILTVGKTFWSFEDKSLLNEVSEEMDIVRIDDINPAAIGRDIINQLLSMYEDLIDDKNILNEYLNRINSNEDDQNLMFIPEYQIVWTSKVLDSIEQYINMNTVDLIYTSADPHADNFIGYYLKEKYNKPWVADFRDAWTQNPYTNYDKNEIKYKMECELEKKLVKAADHVITVSPVISDQFINNISLENNCVTTITNGYDEEDFKHIKERENKNIRFTIIHNGLFYQKRSPIPFLTAIKRIIEENLISKEKIKVQFTRKDKWVKIVEDYGLSDIVEFTGYMDHLESLQTANKADMLLLVIGKGEENKGVFTGKIFEYLRLCKPILALSPQGSVVDKLLSDSNRGKNVEVDDTDQIIEYILNIYNAWEANSHSDFQLTNEVKKYERRILTSKLSDIFNKVLIENNKLSNLEDADNNFYNDIYKMGGWNETYFKNYTETHYYPMWKKALEIIKSIDNPSIIDIGCGPGQFANLLFDNELNKYKGLDFSEEAILIAKERNSKYKQLFKVDDAYTSIIFKEKYNIVVLFEILEHIKNDLQVLAKIRQGSHVLLSVPNFYAESHVRWFKDEREVAKRYGKVIEIERIETFYLSATNKLYLLYGAKR